MFLDLIVSDHSALVNSKDDIEKDIKLRRRQHQDPYPSSEKVQEDIKTGFKRLGKGHYLHGAFHEREGTMSPA